jgi:molybdopterin-biosynthesis enzyme MoeA-like protein
MRNVFILPGVPRLMQRKFEDIASRFAGETVHTARLATARHETDIASLLTTTQASHATVSIGSYPRYDDVPFRVIVTIEGRDLAAVESARAALADGLPDPVDP